MQHRTADRVMLSLRLDRSMHERVRELAEAGRRNQTQQYEIIIEEGLRRLYRDRPQKEKSHAA